MNVRSTAADPRETITPESFTIDSSLLGAPLARPLRRAGAMAVDLLLIALLVNAGNVLFGIAVAWVFLRISSKAAGGSLLRRSWRFAFRSVAAIVLFAVGISLWGSWQRPGTPRAARERPPTELARAEADPARQTPVVASLDLDSLLEAYSAARSRGDRRAVTSLHPLVARAIAADTLTVLQSETERLERRNQRLEAQLSDARSQRGIRSLLRTAADDLGLTFGWSGLYFTAFLALWGGQTPGKRMFRIRVLRLDGKPITWWTAFERFGGYAASIFTGLLGFLQIAWDRNRQGMHDKISETVVIRL